MEDLVILSGQAAYRMDFAALVNAHRASGADITLATYCVDPADAARMGVVQVDPITRASASACTACWHRACCPKTNCHVMHTAGLWYFWLGKTKSNP